MCAPEEPGEKPERFGTSFHRRILGRRERHGERLRDVHQAPLTTRREGQTRFRSLPALGGGAIKIQNIKLVDLDGTRRRRTLRGRVLRREQLPIHGGKGSRPRLPVLFVDEQIYQEVPSFLVATVDKFARMPWRGDAGILFGRATHADERRVYGVMDEPRAGAKPLPEGLLPPELIVQDELHLISGPLGTMVGL